MGSAVFYHSKEGESLDEIVWRHYSAETRGALETVLEANPGLAAKGPILPMATKVLLPSIDAPKEIESTRLWD